MQTYFRIDGAREVIEWQKGDGRSDDDLPKEEQEICHFVKNCHPNLDTMIL